MTLTTISRLESFLNASHRDLAKVKTHCLALLAMVGLVLAWGVPEVSAQVSVFPVINTIAGNGSAGYGPVGNVATATAFGSVSASAIDRSGNIYVALETNHIVVEIVAGTGVVKTIAGTGTSGFSGDGTQATTAKITNPTSLALYGGSLYIADYGNYRIRAVNLTTGIITTVAGSATSGNTGDGALATSATFASPTGIAFDASGNLYVSDQVNCRIRKVVLGGNISALVGNGTCGNSGDGGAAGSASLRTPYGMAFDASGNMYVVDQGNNRIRLVTASSGVVSASSIISNFAGNSGGASGNTTSVTVGNAYLNAPNGIAFDPSGNLYIADTGNYGVRLVAADSSGAISSSSILNGYVGTSGSSGFAGDNGARDSSSARLNTIRGISTDSSGNLYIADKGNSRLRVVSSNLNFPSTAVGSSSAVQNVLIRFGSTGTYSGVTISAGQGGAAEFSVGTVTGCTSGNSVSFVSTCVLPITFTPAYPGTRSAQLKVTASGGSNTNAYFGPSGPATAPLAVFSTGTNTTVATSAVSYQNAVDSAGNLYAINGSGIVRYAAGGGSSTVLLASTSCTDLAVDAAGDVFCWANGTTVYLLTPGASAVSTYATLPAAADHGGVTDMAGNLYIGSSGGAIYKIAAGTKVITTLNTFGSRVTGLAIDSSGNLFVTDYTNNAVSELPSGSATRTSLFTASNAHGLAIDPAGNLYVGSYTGGSSAGNLVKYAYSGGTYTASTTAAPSGSGVTIDGAGNLYITNGNNTGALNYYGRLSPPTVNFGTTTPAGYAATAQSVTLESDGTNPLVFTSFSASPASYTESPVTCSTSTALAVGSSCTFSVGFTPAKTGSIPGTGNTVDNSAPTSSTTTTSTQTVTLAGSGASYATTTSLATSNANISQGTSVTFTATVNPPSTGAGSAYTPVGTVTFNDGSTAICSNAAMSGSTATCTTSSLSGGTHSITAVFTPSNAGYTTSTSAALTETVVVPTTVTDATQFVAPVGTSSATQTITMNFTSSDTLASSNAVNVLTTGISGLDFQVVSGGTCANGFTGTSCTVMVQMTPIAPGARKGAVTIYDSNGLLIATAFLNGLGQSPLAVFTNGLASTIGPSLQTLRGLSVDAAGNLYGTQQDGVNEIVKLTNSSGTYTYSVLLNAAGTVGGTVVDGAGNLYYHQINGTVFEVLAGQTTPTAVATIPSTSSSYQMTADTAGNVYVSDSTTGGLYKIAAGTHVLTTLIASGASVAAGSVGQLIGLTIDASSNLYASDATNNRLYELVYSGGAYATSWTTLVNADGNLNLPNNLAIDAAGNLYVANQGTANVLKYTAGTTYAGSVSGLAAEQNLAIDGAGNLYTDGTNQLTGNVPVAKYARTTTPGLTFVNVPVGKTSATQQVLMENDGNTSLTFTSLASASPFAFVGGNAPACSSTTPTAAGGSCYGLASFSPTATGSFTGTGTYTDNSLNVSGATQTVSLYGTTTTNMGTTSQTITFTAPASPALSGTSATLSASASSGLAVVFSVVSGPATISGNVVTYTGTGTVVIAADQPGNATYTAAPTVTRSVTVNGPAVVSSLTQFSSNVGQASATQQATVTFSSTTKLGSVSAVTTGVAGLDFSIVSGSGSTCVANFSGTSCTVTVKMTPTAPGLRRGAINLYNTGSPAVLVGTVYLNGQAISPLGVFPVGTQATVDPGTGNQTAHTAVDAAGNLYTLASGNLTKFIAGTGSGVTLVAGIGSQNNDVGIDGAGNVYYWVYNGSTLYELPAGATTPVSITGFTSVGGFSGFDHGFAADGNGNLYIGGVYGGIFKVAATSHAISVLVAPGSTSSGTPPTGGGTFTRAPGMDIDAAGNLYVTDYNNSAVYEVVAGSTALTTLIYRDGNLNGPHGIAVDPAGNLYVTNYNTDTLYKYAYSGGAYTASLLSTPGSDLGNEGVTIDGNGNLYTTTTNNVVYKYTRATGATVTLPTTQSGATSAGQNVAFENDGNATLSMASITGSTLTPSSSPNAFTFFGNSSPVNACQTSLAVGASCNAYTTFSPSSNSAYTGLGTIVDNSLYNGNNTTASNTNQTVPLAGQGSTNASPTITFTPASPALVANSATLSATSSQPSAGTITYAVTGGTGSAKISGTTITYTGVGTVIITATQPGNSTYASASQSATVTVVNSVATASYNSSASVYVGNPFGPVTATFKFTTATTLGSPAYQVLSLGNANYNYTATGGSCAANTAYAVNATCTVTYNVTPKAPGLLKGAVNLLDTSGAVVATLFVTNTGLSPLGVFPAGVNSLLTSYYQYYPRSVTVDTAGTVYEGNANGIIVKLSASTGAFLSQFTTTGYNTRGLAIDGAGNLYFTDESTLTLYETAAGTTSYAAVATLPSAAYYGLTVDGAGNVYVGMVNGGITKVAANTHTVSTFVPSGTFPQVVTGLTVDSNGNLFVVNQTAAIYMVNSSGSVSTVLTDATNTASNAFGVAVDAADNLYVSSRTTGRVIRYQNTGSYTVPAYSTSSANVQILSNLGTGIIALAVDGAGNIYTTNDATSNGNPNGTYKYTRSSGATLTFPNTKIATTSAALPVAIENDGNNALRVSFSSSSTQTLTPNTTSGIFTDVSTGASCGSGTFSVAVGASCTVNTTFSPTSNVAYTGQLNIADNNLNNYPGTYSQTATNANQAVPLAGTGSSTTQTLTFTLPTPAAVGSSATLAASTNATPTASYPITYAVTGGTGSASISGSTITYTGTGTVTVTATQAGDTTYASATASSTVTVNSSATSTQLALTVPVGSSGNGTVTFTFTSSTTVNGSYNVHTEGFNSLDFTGSSTTCTSKTYTTGQTCTVTVKFAPTAPGLRLGAVELLNSAGNVVATAFVGGTGTSPLGLYSTGVSSTIGTGLSVARGLTVDVAGNVYLFNQGTKQVYKYTYSSGSYTQSVVATAANTSSSTVIDGDGNLYYGIPLGVTGAGIYEIPLGTTTPILLTSAYGTDSTMAADGAGNIYFALRTNGTIYKMAAGTHAVTTLVSGGSHVTNGTVGAVDAITIDAAGNLYLADFSNNRLYELVAGASTLTTLVNNDGLLSGPHALAIDPAGNLYVTNYGNKTTVKYVNNAGTWTGTSLNVAAGVGITIDGSGNLYLLYQTNLIKYTRTAPPTTVFPSTAGGATSAPKQIPFENDGNVALSITAIGATSTSPAATGTFTQAGSTSPACPSSGSLAIAGTCNLGEEFTPASGTAANSTLAGFGTITDNTLNVAGTVQQAALLGTNGTTAQTITFSPASPVTYSSGVTVTLNGTASSGLAVTYTIVSGPGVVTGSGANATLTLTGPGTVVIQADQAGDATYAAAPSVQASVVSRATTSISWLPSTTTAAPGKALGTGILDATGQYVSGYDPSTGAAVYTAVSGTVAYSATNTSTGVVTSPITSTSTLAAGTYTLTATFTPTDTTSYTSSTASITLTVRAGTIFVANSNGTVSEYSSTGSAIKISTSGGGIGLGIDSTGTVYSLSNPGSASTMSTFSDANVAGTSYSYLNASGNNSTSGAQALAVDGAGTIWIAQSETESGGTAGDIAMFSNGSVTARIAGDASIGTPSGIVVDASGSLWITSSNNTVVEVIGAATPVETPLVQSLTDGTLAKQP